MKVKPSVSTSSPTISALENIEIRGDLTRDADGFESTKGSRVVPPGSFRPRLWSIAKTAVNAVLIAAMFATVPAQAEVHQRAVELALSQPARGASLGPPAFEVAGGRAVFVDITKVTTELVIDAKSDLTVGRARVEFEQQEKGFPIVDLVHEPTAVRLDGKAVSPEQYRIDELPESGAQIRLLGVEVAPGSHQLDVSYQLENRPDTNPPKKTESGAISFETSLHDHGERLFSELYGPSNLEYDRYPSELTIRIENGHGPAQQLVANGTVTELSPSAWKVEYPATFNTSSPYLRLLDPAEHTLTKDTYESVDGRQIPIELVTRGSFEVAPQLEVIKKSLRDGEMLYGPYGHPKLLIDMVPSRFGNIGMEYAGAANAIPYSLRHEIGHMWMGRGARPVDGRAGVIDEMITEWFGRNSPNLSELSSPTRGAPELMRVFDEDGAYQRRTNVEAYSTGLSLVAYLNEALAESGGIAPRLATFYTRFADKTYSVEDFVKVLRENATPTELEQVNQLLGQVGLLRE